MMLQNWQNFFFKKFLVHVKLYPATTPSNKSPPKCKCSLVYSDIKTQKETGTYSTQN